MECPILNVKSALSKLTSLTPIKPDMDRVKINKSIMELNYKKEKLQNEVDTIQDQIYFLASLRESQRPTEDDTDERSLFDKMFGGTD